MFPAEPDETEDQRCQSCDALSFNSYYCFNAFLFTGETLRSSKFN